MDKKQTIEAKPAFVNRYKVACCTLRILINFDPITKKPIYINATSDTAGGCSSNHEFISQLASSLLKHGDIDSILKLKTHACNACTNLRKKSDLEKKKEIYRSCGDAISHALEEAIASKENDDKQLAK